MKKYLVMILLSFASLQAMAQNDETTIVTDDRVNVSARGTDFRLVLHDMFSQTKRNFIVELGASYSLFLNLANVDFESALDLICKNVGMAYRVEEGVYVFFKPPVNPPQTQKPVQSQPAPKKPLDPKVLDKKLTVRFQQTDIRQAFQEIGKQTSVPIEVSDNVKKLKINAILLDTSLRYALNTITKSANLMYTLTDRGTILISDPNAVPLKTNEVTTSAQTQSVISCSQCSKPVDKGWVYCPHCGNYVKQTSSL